MNTAMRMMKDAEQEEALALLKRLVETDTQNPTGQESRLADFLTEFLEGTHATLQRISCRETGRDSLVARLPGAGKKRPLILCGHMDTVPAGDKAAWSVPPLALTIREGRAYGRGTSDMKSGLAAITYAFRQAACQDNLPYGDIYLAATADEESGGLGAAAMSPYLPLDTGVVYIAEPTGNDIGVSAKGTLWLQARIQGRTAHGAYPERGINAIDMAYELHRKLAVFCARHKDPLLGPATCTLTGIRGGVKTNMIADTCVLTMDIRTTPDLPNEDVLAEAQRIARQLREDYLGLQRVFSVQNDRAAVQVAPDALEVRVLARTIADKTGKEPRYKGIKFFSDASIFVRNNPFVPCIQFGPGREDHAHIVDEYVELSSYFSSIVCYNKLLASYFR